MREQQPRSRTFEIEKLPWGSGKVNACGGSVRRLALEVSATSNEAGRLSREAEMPLAFRHGEMSLGVE
jgi:hypothetical protein